MHDLFVINDGKTPQPRNLTTNYHSLALPESKATPLLHRRSACIGCAYTLTPQGYEYKNRVLQPGPPQYINYKAQYTAYAEPHIPPFPRIEPAYSRSTNGQISES